jgi:peptidoglycan/LPS O-acetylase OafA/YrhL
MNRGCLALAGLGLLSLLAFGVTLEAINDPKQLTAIPFTPWDFLIYSLIAVATAALIRLVRKPDPHNVLARKWMSRVAPQGGRIRTNLRLAPDGTAVIDTIVSNGADSRKFSTQARWQLLDNTTLHLWGTQTAAWKILKLDSWSMITADQARAGLPVRWIAFPKVNLKLWLLIAAAVLLPVLFALSLPRSQPSRAIADDPQHVPASTPHRTHRFSR